MPMVQEVNMNQISLHREDFKAISGIGSVVKVSINNVINGDAVIITKTIVDESGW